MLAYADAAAHYEAALGALQSARGLQEVHSRAEILLALGAARDRAGGAGQGAGGVRDGGRDRARHA